MVVTWARTGSEEFKVEKTALDENPRCSAISAVIKLGLEILELKVVEVASWC